MDQTHGLVIASPRPRRLDAPFLCLGILFYLRAILKNDRQWATAAALMPTGRAFYDIFGPVIDYTNLTLGGDNVKRVLKGIDPREYWDHP